MTHLPFTVAAYFFNALSVTANKFLLKNAIPDPLTYIFYISLFSLLIILALPFTKIPTLATFNIASLSTILWTMGAYFMLKALKIGQVSRVIPIIGTLIPLILLIFASGTNTITTTQTWAVWVLVLGMVILTMTDWKGHLEAKEIVFEVLSASLFAFSYLALREAYLSSDFFSVLVWSRLILLPLGAVVLIIPSLRRKVIHLQRPKLNFFSKTGAIFLGGQASGVASELLILFSISLANPALVNSLQGTQYIFLLILAREKYPPKVWISKFMGIALIGVGLYLLSSR